MTTIVTLGGCGRVVVGSANGQVVTGGGMGVQGQPGIGIQLLGTFASLSALQAAHPTGVAGDAYAVAGDLYVWDADTSAWNNAGSFRGLPGQPGQIRFTGNGSPGTIIGASPDDTYLDLDTGTVYKLT